MDHDRVNISHSPMSCGVMELSRMSSEPEEVAYAVASRLYHPSRGAPVAFCCWSDVDVDANTSSNLFHRFILSNKLGKVTNSPFVENPKTGNIIYVCIWSIDHERFKDWYSKKRVEKLSKTGT